jgi:Icc-related predicted phosphoesterase
LEERFSALERLVATANQRDAHFLVVAGDLFDKQTVTKGQHGATTGLTPRHAKLAVGAAATLSIFLFETHEQTK